MGTFLAGLEAKLFCLVITIFLFCFQTRKFQTSDTNGRLMYMFSIAGIFALSLGSLVKTALIQNTFFIICALFNGLSVFFVCRSFSKNCHRNGLYSLFGVVFAVLTFYSERYKTDVAAYLLTFGILVSFVMEQYNRIRVDNLTKLYNRYGMDAELREQLRQYERENTDSFYVIACDMDNFKYINDTWGHLEGDRALVLIASVLSKVSKKFRSDAFRIGGDEFVIITDKSERDLAENITAEIKRELDNLKFRDDYDINMSIGVALYDGVTPIDELLNNADKKLYEAKKNKSVSYR